MSDVKRFWIGFVLICLGSVVLHVTVFNRRHARTEHYPAQYATGVREAQAFVPEGPPIVGVVRALCADRFYLEHEGHTTGFLCPTQQQPPLGTKVRVFYYQGTPPQVLRLEPL